MSIEEKAVNTEGKTAEEEAVEEKPVNLDQLIMDSLRELTSEKKQEVLDFVEFLQQKNKRKKPFKSAKGSLAHLNIDFNEEDLYEVRREMWANFPRDITL